MMSGVDYISNMHNKTITHDYVNGQRQDGGLFNLSDVIASINQSPEITDVSMTAGFAGGTTVSFSLNRLGEAPSNWTISWGDNSGVDQSGVEVLLGSAQSAQHTFPRDIQPHYYFPTIYAMSGTKQVYLPAPSAQAQVLIDTPMGLTSGKDEYILSRSGTNLVVTLGSLQQTFAPGELPKSILYLGQGGDTVTIDFTNGDPLEFTQLIVRGTSGAGNMVRVIGSPGADTIQNLCFTTITVNGSLITVDQTVTVHIDAAGGNDHVTTSTLRATTILAGRVTIRSTSAAGPTSSRSTAGPAATA
jgi:hypothetical protein